MANAVASLTEIADSSPSAVQYFEMNSATINKLLTALNECTELVFFVDIFFLVSYFTACFLIHDKIMKHVLTNKTFLSVN